MKPPLVFPVSNKPHRSPPRRSYRHSRFHRRISTWRECSFLAYTGSRRFHSLALLRQGGRWLVNPNSTHMELTVAPAPPPSPITSRPYHSPPRQSYPRSRRRRRISTSQQCSSLVYTETRCFHTLAFLLSVETNHIHMEQVAAGQGAVSSRTLPGFGTLLKMIIWNLFELTAEPDCSASELAAPRVICTSR